MSPRRNQHGAPSPRGFGRAGDAGLERTEEGPDGAWVMRPVGGAAATKAYRCPGCDQEIPPGVGHLVVWPADHRGATERRHWHRPCWENRAGRRPRTLRSRDAPRY